MCFVVHPKHPTAKIAKKDTHCYKILNKDLSPYFREKGIPYKLGVLNDRITLHVIQTMSFMFGVTDDINEGYHSLSSLSRALGDFDIYSGKYCNTISFRHPPVLAGCIIPKGEQYYFNPTIHEYVSTNIIIKEIIK